MRITRVVLFAARKYSQSACAAVLVKDVVWFDSGWYCWTILGKYWFCGLYLVLPSDNNVFSRHFFFVSNITLILNCRKTTFSSASKIARITINTNRIYIKSISNNAITKNSHYFQNNLKPKLPSTHIRRHTIYDIRLLSLLWPSLSMFLWIPIPLSQNNAWIVFSFVLTAIPAIVINVSELSRISPSPQFSLDGRGVRDKTGAV